jgi:hypothetical protein
MPASRASEYTLLRQGFEVIRQHILRLNTIALAAPPEVEVGKAVVVLDSPPGSEAALGDATFAAARGIVAV